LEDMLAALVTLGRGAFDAIPCCEKYSGLFANALLDVLFKSFWKTCWRALVKLGRGASSAWLSLAFDCRVALPCLCLASALPLLASAFHLLFICLPLLASACLCLPPLLTMTDAHHYSKQTHTLTHT
jgi:hypothetical protein